MHNRLELCRAPRAVFFNLFDFARVGVFKDSVSSVSKDVDWKEEWEAGRVSLRSTYLLQAK